MISFYNKQGATYEKALRRASGEPPAVEDVIDVDARKISWSRGLKNDLRKLKPINFDADCTITSLYRPYCKQQLYFNRQLNEYPSLNGRLFPTRSTTNLLIAVAGIGANKEFSALV